MKLIQLIKAWFPRRTTFVVDINFVNNEILVKRNKAWIIGCYDCGWVSVPNIKYYKRNKKGQFTK